MTTIRHLAYELHRKLSIWIALPLALWALSGILHPMMANWFKPEIENVFLPPRPLPIPAEATPPGQVFSDIEHLHQLRVIPLGGTVAYLAITPGQELHVRSISGEPIANGVERYVEERARAYLGDPSSVLAEIEVLDHFSATYTTINRYLPAYRVKLDRADGMEVVIDARTGKLATFSNRPKRVMMRLFSWFHTWSFLGGPLSILRIGVVAFVSLISLSVAISGLINLFKIRRRGKATSKALRAHRTIGGLVAIIYLMFSLSAIAHVLIKLRADNSTQWVSRQKVATGQLSTVPQSTNGKPLLGASLAVVGGAPYYRLHQATAPRESETLLIGTESQRQLENGEVAYAHELALEFSGYAAADISGTTLITKFQPDYGFIFKRLPVWRVSFEGKPYWQYTVDTADAHMSMRTDLPGLLEALTFINLHKWHFLDFAGRETRDIATVAAALLMFCLVVSGVLLSLSKRRRRGGS